MTAAETVLEFTVKELVPEGTSVHQTEDGTTFYYKYQKPERLYVKFRDVEVDVEMPDGSEINEITAKYIYDNSVYFVQYGKIYRAHLTAADTFTASLLREKSESETITFGGLCRQIRDGKKVVYRLCDDPDKDGVIVDVPEQELDGLELRGIHRGKAIYQDTRSGREPGATRPSSNAVNIVCLKSWAAPFMRDSSRVIYLTNQDNVFALDSETLLFLRMLSCGDTPIRSILSVRGDILTVRGRKDGQECLMTARLPELYVSLPGWPEDSWKLKPKALNEQNQE